MMLAVLGIALCPAFVRASPPATDPDSLAAGTAPASTLPEPGTRIRLTARMPERQRWTGRFVSVVNDTLTMRPGDKEGGLLAVSMLDVTRLEVSRGTRSNSLRSAGWGFVIGAVLGGVVGYAGTNNSNDLYGAGFDAAAGAVVVGILGAAVGAVHGARNPSEHWRDVNLKDLRAAGNP